MFAYHDDDPASESKIKYHTFRGSRTLMLLNSMDKRNINETGWFSFPITTKNVRTIQLLLIPSSMPSKPVIMKSRLLLLIYEDRLFTLFNLKSNLFRLILITLLNGNEESVLLLQHAHMAW